MLASVVAIGNLVCYVVVVAQAEVGIGKVPVVEIDVAQLASRDVLRSRKRIEDTCGP